MTVQELIDILKDMTPDHEVQAWDPDVGDYMPVTSVVFGGIGTVELQTDVEP